MARKAMTSRSSRGFGHREPLREKPGERAKQKHGKAQAVRTRRNGGLAKLTLKVCLAMPRENGLSLAYRFEWDENKNRLNIEKHGLDFADAKEMFSGVLFFWPDLREDYGESRWSGIGKIRGRVAVVAFTDRGPETIRIISLRKANRRESKKYEKAIEDGLEAR